MVVFFEIEPKLNNCQNWYQIHKQKFGWFLFYFIWATGLQSSTEYQQELSIPIRSISKWAFWDWPQSLLSFCLFGPKYVQWWPISTRDWCYLHSQSAIVINFRVNLTLPISIFMSLTLFLFTLNCLTFISLYFLLNHILSPYTLNISLNPLYS